MYRFILKYIFIWQDDSHTKLISIQTLADFRIVDPQWLKNSWESFNVKLYPQGRLTVLKTFFEQIDLLFKEFFHCDFFRLNILDYIDETEDNVAIFYQNLQLVLGLIDSKNSSSKFKGITQYKYQNIKENILGKRK